jgi:hypothetical protein
MSMQGEAAKAPMMAPVYNWTGFYIFGGGEAMAR